MTDAVEDPITTAARGFRWMRIHGATPPEAAYLTATYPDVDPGRATDLTTSAKLYAQHRDDSRPGGRP